MYDTINDQTSWTSETPFCLVLEWMDTTLAEVPFEKHTQGPVLIADIFKTTLEAFAELQKEKLVYSGTPFAPGRSIPILYTKQIRPETWECSHI
jgi:hypothetical protein